MPASFLGEWADGRSASEGIEMDMDDEWGGDNLPLWIRERIRGVDENLTQLTASIAQLRSVLVGYAAGMEHSAQVGAERVAELGA